jgi:hypothetical protein
MLERGAADVTAVRLVEVALVVGAEVILEELLVDLLDEGEEAEVDVVEGELGVGVLRGGHTDPAEQVPRQRFAHLRRVVVHGLHVEAVEAEELIGIHLHLPRPLRHPERAVAAVHE